MSLFKRKPPEEEEEFDVPELSSEPPFSEEEDVFPLPSGAHSPLPPRAPPRRGPVAKPLPMPEKPAFPTPRGMPMPVPVPVERYKEELEALDAPEPVVTEDADALSELEELLRPGAATVRTARGLVRVADITEPEMLRAFVDLVGNPTTIAVVEALAGKENSLEEVAANTKSAPDKVKRILQQLVCLGLVEDFWYKTPSGKHINKFKFVNTTGTLDFDLKDLGKALDVQKLEEKSALLVDLVSREGKVPTSLVIKELELSDDDHLKQIVRFTEKFKLPSIKGLIMEDAPEIEEEAPPLAAEIMPLPKREVEEERSSGFEEEFDVLDKYMKKLEEAKK